MQTQERRKGSWEWMIAIYIFVAIAIMVNGAIDFSRATPSPHSYIEVFWVFPQVALGATLSIFSLLALSPNKWVRFIGGLMASLTALATVAFVILYLLTIYGSV